MLISRAEVCHYAALKDLPLTFKAIHWPGIDP
jgi:hypothetical protein